MKKNITKNKVGLKNRKVFSIIVMIALFVMMATDTLSQELERVYCSNGYWGYVDKSSRRTIIPCEYVSVRDFSEGLAAVLPYQDYYFWGFIDKTGKEVIPFKFQRVENFSEGLAAVKLNDKWGFIDKNGTEIVPCIYDMHNSLELERERVMALEREKMSALERDGTVQKQEATPTFTTNAIDIIMLNSGNEIKAKVTEITLSEIKYKAFEYLDGPTRTVAKSDVFVIIYENGTREIFNATTETKIPSSKRQNITNCAKKTAFGLDIGIGGNSKYKIFAPALGIRVMHHFSPYIGIDFFKINWITDVQVYESFNSWAMSLQIMPGVRGNSPTFLKCMSVYAAFRLGYGMQVASVSNIPLYNSVTDFKGLCMETELGINLTATVFAGFAYNFHKHFSIPEERHTFAFRVGFNFGK